LRRRLEMPATLEFPETDVAPLQSSEAAVWLDGERRDEVRLCPTSTTYVVLTLDDPELLEDYADAREALRETQEQGAVSWEDLKAELGI
jgi:hypothetical protein